MGLFRFYYHEFMRSDLFLKGLLVSFVTVWSYNLLHPKRPMIVTSNLEAVLAFGFFFMFIAGSVGIFLALESKGGEIEWKGCETPEARTLITKLLVRGGLITTLVVGLL